MKDNNEDEDPELSTGLYPRLSNPSAWLSNKSIV